MNNNLLDLYLPVRGMVLILSDLLQKNHIDMYVKCTGRTMAEQAAIYPHDLGRFTLHYVGLAVDFYPKIVCPASEWTAAFNGWPHWDKFQNEFAVQAGFDVPAGWQIARDRPHVQCLFGMPESMIETVWRNKSGTEDEKTEAVWQYINCHKKEPCHD